MIEFLVFFIFIIMPSLVLFIFTLCLAHSFVREVMNGDIEF